jgi:hypothetical protein
MELELASTKLRTSLDTTRPSSNETKAYLACGIRTVIDSADLHRVPKWLALPPVRGKCDIGFDGTKAGERTVGTDAVLLLTNFPPQPCRQDAEGAAGGVVCP